MNYTRIHDSIIARARTRETSGYFERHHVLPRSLGGSDSPENLVKLTAKEHYIIHKLLVRMFPDEYKLAYALWMMCMRSKYTTGRRLVSVREYEEAKLAMSEATKRRLKENNPWSGRKHSEESKKKQSESAKARDTSNEVLRRSKISSSHKGKKKSLEHTKNISDAKKGARNPMFGKKWRLVDGKRIFY